MQPTNMLDVSCKALSFDEVAVNDIPSYRSIHVRNTTDATLSIGITSSSSLLHFQLSNENYDGIQRVGLRDFLSVYNEAFDLVGLISSLELAPREEKEIVVSFRAEAAAFAHLVTGAQAAPFNGSVQLSVTSAASIASSAASGSAAAGNANGSADGAEAENNKNPSKSATDGSAAAAGQLSEAISIPFRASVYVSFLKLSSSEIQVSMAPNKTQVVDFIVTNTSCQPVLFLIRDQAMPLKGLDVALYEADKFEDPKLGHRILLDSYASMTFSLLLRSSGANANAQLQYHTMLQCDNLRDNRNTTFLYVNVNVGNDSQGDFLAIPDTSIEFGDVYRGTKAFAQLRIQNIDGREDAVVRLGDADRRKHDGKFSLMKGDAPVDELIIAAQKGNPMTTVTLMYQPSYDVDSKEAAKKKFDVELLAQSASRTNTQRIVVRCAATLYTSNIVVSQRSVNFGDCQVGQSKRYTLQIENRSPLQGKIVVQLRSKIIQIEGVSRTNKNAGRELREEFTIAPSASLPLTLKITPQRVNPMYRKQLTIINASNPAEERQVINIEANNMAPLDTKLHDELYSWKCDLAGSSGNNNNSSTDGAGTRRGPGTLWAISNVPLLVPYSVQSKVDHEVVLNMRSTSPEIEVCYSIDPALSDKLSAVSADLRRFCLFGEGEDTSYLTNESAEQLYKAREELVKLLSETSHNITNRIVLEPRASLKAYALIIRTACPTEPLTKEDGISIAVDGIDAPRFVRLSYRLCGTTFELNGQKTKNFGEVNIGVKKTTKLPIVNRCNSFLFLQLSKSRSVTAEHIRMEHSDKQSIFLTIRPYASREIELTLYPGIKGVFQEKIRVTNILNIQNSITMTIKAVVTKADTFEISPDSWTFEMMVPPSASAAALMAPSAMSSAATASAEDGASGGGGGNGAAAASNSRVGAKFTVANMSNARRQIIARVELNNSNAGAAVTPSNPYLAFPGVKVAVQLDMALTGAASVSTRKLEEQIEKLEQKLKIYVRKKKTEKAENARRKIEAFRLALKGEEVDLSAIESTQSSAQGMTDHDLSESEDEGSTSTLQALKNKMQQSDLAQLLRREGVALPSMGAGETVNITVFLVCKRIVEETIPVTQSQTMNILFYEARDQEANRIIPIDMILMRTPGDTFPNKAPAALDTSAVSAKLLASAADAAQSGNSSAHGAETAAKAALSAAGGVAVAASAAGALRAQQARPPPMIRLTTSGALPNNSTGHLHSTFMGHPLLVLRNCIVNDQTEFTFLVEADGDTTIVVLEPRRCGGSVPEVLDARFKLFPRNGHVRQREPLRIVVECTARSVGPQKYFIPVKNIRNAADVHYLTVEMNPTEEIDMLTTEPKELIFRDVLTPCAPSQLESQVVLIRSRFPFPHALVVRTNKPSQIALFEDASCTVPLLHPIRRIFVRETVRVYVQLRPGARYVDPRARNIHAGVLVEALAPNPAVSSTAFCVVGKAVLRAVACVGSGLVEVPQRSLELGCVQPTQHYAKTQFVVRNTSHSFALRIGLAPSSPLVDVVDETASGEEITLAPLQEHVVALVLHLPSPGLAHEYIDVVNHSSAQETIRVALSALRLNDGIMQVEPAVNTPLAFPIAAVVRGENGKDLHLHQPVSCSIRMANYHSNREVVLATTATTPSSRELPLWFHTSEEEAQVRNAFEEEQRQANDAAEDERTSAAASSTAAASAAAGSSRSGTTAPTSTPTTSQPPSSTYVKGRVELQANRAQVVMWTLTDLPELTAGEAEAVLQHQLVTIAAIMQVCVTYTAHSAKTGGWQSHNNNRYRGPSVGQCVLLVPITLTLAMSEGRAEPAVVNLGLVAKPTSLPASPTSAGVEVSSDDDDSTADAEDGAASPNHNHHNGNEEAVFAARVRRRRRVRNAQLRRPGNHQQFSSYSAKSGLQQASSNNLVVTFHLVNLSPVMPLPLKVECPPVIRFSQTRLTLPPGASTAVEATLNLKLITTQGSFRYEAFFVNEWNPENDMAVCITGQHYWKVFKILRTDTDEELRDAVTLTPLRIEPSSLAPLSELKLAFVATEPDVEFDLHVQPNPKLEGLLELLLLHYDATSAAQHLSFRSDLPIAPTGGAANTAGINTAGGTASSSAPATNANANAAATSPTSAAPPSGFSAATGAAAPPASTGDDATSGASGAVGSAVPALPSQTQASGGAVPVVSTTAAASVGSSAAAPSQPASAAAAAVAGNTKAIRKPGAQTTGSGGTTSGGTSTAVIAAATRSVRLRLRCMLRSGDLASLVTLFYGFRRTRTTTAAAATGSEATAGSFAAAASSAGKAAASGAPGGADAAAAGGVGAIAATPAANAASSQWTYDRIAELERRAASMVSNNVWLGTVWVANPFTEDEEVQVYSTLSPFRTFSAPSKVTLRPCRISVEGWRATTSTADGASSTRSLQVGYVGEIAITNVFDVYVADLSVVVLVSDRLAVPLEIDVRGGSRVVASADPSASPGENGGGAAVGSLAASTATNTTASAPAASVATSFVAAARGDGAMPASQPHCVQLGPHETVVLTVAIRQADARAQPSAAATAAAAAHFSLTALEQNVSVVVLDDNVPFSYKVSRVSVVTPADGAEALPTVTLSASSPPPAPLPPQSSPAPSAASTAADVREAERNTRSPTPPASVPLTPQSRGAAKSATASPAPPAAPTALERSAELPPAPVSRRSSTHTSHTAAEDGLAPLPPPMSAELSAIETTSVDTADAPIDANAAASLDTTAELSAVQPRDSAAGGVIDGLSATATTASALTSDGAAATPRRWTLSLRNCDPLPGCGGAYTSTFSVSRDDTYDPNILITNHLPSAAVRYAVQVVSQSPQVWLLLTATSGVLEAGETHPLRLQVLSSDVGSFVGYVAITNVQDTREVVYLRLNAEIFVPGTAEGLFDVIAMNGGHRLATTSAVHCIDMGALYGSGTTRSHIALEIVNKGNVALEFPVSVVHPMRQELRPIPQSVWYGNAVTTSSHRRRHANATSIAATPRQLGTSSSADGAAGATPSALSVSSSALSIPQAAGTTAGSTEMALQPYELALRTRSPQRTSHHQHHHHHHHSPGGGSHQHRGAVSRVNSSATTVAAAASAAAMNASSAAPFEGKLVVCHIHNVQTRTGQKYFVVDPRSPLRLAFLLSCNALRDIPDGYGVFGEADVVFKCKQARDAQFTFTVKFEAYKPTFAVALEYDMDAADADAPQTAVDASVPRPARAAASPSRWAETAVAVTNLSRTHTQVFVLFTQSEVLTLTAADEASAAPDPAPGSQLLPPWGNAAGGEDGAAWASAGAAYPTPSVELSVPPQSVGVFVVRLDRLRAEALLNFDKDESTLARPALCEHAYLYNKGNPRERVRLLFRQHPVSAPSQRQGGRLDEALLTARPLSPTRADAKPVKGNGTQHFSERHILGFAQRFSAVLTALADRLPFVARAEETADSGGPANISGGGSGADALGVGGGAAAGGAAVGDYGSSARASAGVAAVSGANTPGPTHRHRPAGHQSRPSTERDSGSAAAAAARGRGSAAMRGGLLGSSTDSSLDDSTASTTTTTTTTSSSDSDDGGDSATGDDGDRTLNSTLTEESNGLLTRTLREAGEEAMDVDGSVSRVRGMASARATRSRSDGVDGDRRQRQQTPSALASHPRLRSGEGSADALLRSPNSPPPLSASGAVGQSSASNGPRSSAGHPHHHHHHSRAGDEARWYDALSVLHDLLVELTWLCDELLFYAILLRNSRHVEACGAFLVAAVSQHPVMVAWRRRRGSSGRAREYDIFGRFLDTIDALPRTSGSGS